MIRNVDVTNGLEQWAKPAYALDWDPIGYQWGDPDAACRGVTVALDLTAEVLTAAEAAGANLIITHHPTWFKPVSNLLRTSARDALALRAIQAGITVYAAHTNLDAAPEGVSHAYAKSLFPDAEPALLQEIETDDDAAAGFGAIVEFATALPAKDLAHICRTQWGFVPQNLLSINGPAHFTRIGDPEIRNAAFWGGSWSRELAGLLKKKKIELLFTGEADWNDEVTLREEGIICVPTGHGQSEAWILPILQRYLKTCTGSRLPVHLK